MSTKSRGNLLGFAETDFFEHLALMFFELFAHSFVELFTQVSFSISYSPNFKDRTKKLEVVPINFAWTHLVIFKEFVFTGETGLSVGTGFSG